MAIIDNDNWTGQRILYRGVDITSITREVDTETMAATVYVKQCGFYQMGPDGPVTERLCPVTIKQAGD